MMLLNIISGSIFISWLVFIGWVIAAVICMIAFLFLLEGFSRKYNNWIARNDPADMTPKQRASYLAQKGDK